MRQLYISTILFLLMLILSIILLFTTTSQIDELCNILTPIEAHISADDWDTATTQFHVFYQHWKNNTSIFHVILDQDDYATIEENIKRIFGFLQYQDDSQSTSELYALIDSLTYIKLKEYPTLKNIL